MAISKAPKAVFEFQSTAVALASVVIASWLSAAVHAQTPPPEAIAHCRAMDLPAQWRCFKALNEKMHKAAKSEFDCSVRSFGRTPS